MPFELVNKGIGYSIKESPLYMCNTAVPVSGNGALLYVQCSPRNSNMLTTNFLLIQTFLNSPSLLQHKLANGYFKMPLNSNLFQGFLTLNYVDCTVYRYFARLL